MWVFDHRFARRRAMSGTSDIAELLEANARFYEAFERASMDEMSDLWEHSERVLCTHPGWSPLRGWGVVAASFYVLFQAGPSTQFVLSGLAGEIDGPVGWVSVEENLLGPQIGGTVSTLNLFVREADGRWRMVAHQASPVVAVAGPMRAGPTPGVDQPDTEGPDGDRSSPSGPPGRWPAEPGPEGDAGADPDDTPASDAWAPPVGGDGGVAGGGDPRAEGRP